MDIQTLKKLVKLEGVIAETEPLTGCGRYLRGHPSGHDSLVVDTQEQVYFLEQPFRQPAGRYTSIRIRSSASTNSPA